MDKGRYTIYINADLLKKLRIFAIEDESSVSQIVEQLVMNFLQKVGK